MIGPGLHVVANGSGLAVAVGLSGQSASTGSAAIVDVRDQTRTDVYQAPYYRLTARPESVAIAGGIGYIADGSGGLLVMNYVPFDNQGISPTATISASPIDASGPTPGIQVQEGSQIPIRVLLSDDRQVRNVELLVNGVRVANDVSAPFDFVIAAPRLSASATSVSIQVRASDTGGNSSLSNILSYALTPDNSAPTFVASLPESGGVGFNLSSAAAVFDEELDPSRITASSATLVNFGANGVLGGGDDATVPLSSVIVAGGRESRPSPRHPFLQAASD